MITLSKSTALRRPMIRDIFACVFLFLASRASFMGLHPFGAAAFAACIEGSIAYIGIIILCIGLISAASASYIIRYVTAALLFFLISSFFKKRSQLFSSVICSFSILISGVLYSLCYFTGYSSFIMSGIESAVSGIMYIVFFRAYEFISSASARKSIARDELISTALTAGICVTGLSGTSLPLGTSIDGVAAAYVVMCASYVCSPTRAGGAGLGIGFMCSMSSAGAIAVSGFYGLCAIFGSLLKSFGKLGTAVGFLGGTCAALIYSRLGTPIGANAPNIVLGSVIFIFTPEAALTRISELVSGPVNKGDLVSGERIRGFLSENLRRSAEAFNELGSSFHTLSSIRLRRCGADASDMFEDTARSVCIGCKKAHTCWEREFSHTYRRFMQLLDLMEGSGSIDTVPKSVSDRCDKSRELVNEFIHIYNQYRQKELFRGEAARARDIAADQYVGFSNILSQLRLSIEGRLRFNNEIEELLVTELDKKGISLFEISVIELGEERYEIYLGLSSGAYMDVLEETIEAVTGTAAEFESETRSVAKFVTKPRFTVMTGYCAVPCEGCEISGDNIEIFDTDDHRSFVIISDGMGSGADARNESSGIVRLLKAFILAGYDAETAIRTVNSALCIQLENERAATIDMLCIDRMTGIAKLFKIGCAETFFLHGGSTDIIFPMSLPAGMVGEIDLRPQTLRLHEGDVIAMVTDGVTQSRSVEWIRNVLDADTDAQKMAQKITDKALDMQHGTVFDDMTCAVVRIRK